MTRKIERRNRNVLLPMRLGSSIAASTPYGILLNQAVVMFDSSIASGKSCICEFLPCNFLTLDWKLLPSVHSVTR